MPEEICRKLVAQAKTRHRKDTEMPLYTLAPKRFVVDIAALILLTVFTSLSLKSLPKPGPLNS
jgi:hypothetical protein